MLNKIKLYGDLAEITGHNEFEALVNSTGQAVSFLINNFPQLESHMANRYYKVLVDEQEINEQEINFPIGQSEIKFVPVIQGAGGNLGRVLLGGALIAVGMGAFGAFAGKAVSFGAQGIGFSKAAFCIGAALVLSGVSGMLFPMPKMPEFSSEQDPRLSFSFSGTQQTSRAGTPVPVVYGEIITGSVVISGGIDTEQVQV